jgi:hypothetical protein
MTLGHQIVFLLVLAIPIACIAWTVTHEEIFREPREWCVNKSKTCSRLYRRKFFYLFTCEYCFSFYVTALLLFITRFHLLFEDWRGYMIAEFALVWVANVYMSIFNRLRLDIKHENVEIAGKEQEIESAADTKKPLPIFKGKR